MKTAILIAIAGSWWPGSGAAAGDDAAVRIYLPRTVKVDGEQLELGQLGVILCDDVKLESRARAVAMGRAPWPKERLVIDRRTILSRLAACGIRRGRVRFTGSEQVTVSRDEKTIPTHKLLAEAERFLQERRGEKDRCIYQVVRKPQEITVSGSRDLQYDCKLADEAPSGRVKVLVAIRRNGRQLGLREVAYQRMYPVRRAVVAKTIPAGAAVTRDNVEIQTAYAERPAPATWKAPYGLLARRTLQPGTRLGPGLTAEKKPDLVIRRRQLVRMRVQGVGFLVTGMGQALQEGRAGDYIRVRNVDSNRVITARIAFDGVVEPIFKR